jgi:hypothetical protein
MKFTAENAEVAESKEYSNSALNSAISVYSAVKEEYE